MSSNLPTTPGPYFWREKDGDEWCKVCKVGLIKGSHEVGLHAHFAGDSLSVSVVELGGQWAKAHKPDDGVDVYLVCDGRGRPIGAGSDVYEALQNFLPCSTSPEADFIALKNKCGFTCEPVTIYRKEKE